MKFCIHCSNMLYIKIDESDSNNIAYYCRNCGHVDTTVAEEGVCVMRTQLRKGGQKFNHIINRYTKLDPTLPRIYNMKCPRLECKTNEQATSSKEETSEKGPKETEIIYMRYDDDKMKYLYICAECDHVW